MSIISRSFATHDGSFHADEVTACALLTAFDLIDRDRVVRTRDPRRFEVCEYVCDVGGVYEPERGRFDHHQIEYTGSLSSAGMVLLFLRSRKIIDPHLYDYYNHHLILGVDAHDNGAIRSEEKGASFSQIISNFLPIEYGAPPEAMDAAFFEALEFVHGHLMRMKARRDYALHCQASVQKAMSQASYLLLFEEPMPWMESFFELGGERHPAQFVVMPAGAHWKLRGIPPSLSRRMELRHPLPSAWAGLREEVLAEVSHVPGAIFCHKGRFMSIWKTKEDALKALHITLGIS